MRTKRVSLKGLDAYISDVMARHPGFVADINRIVDAANGDVPRPAIPATESGMVAEWGERCPEDEPGCPVCDAWREFDTRTAWLDAARQWAKRAYGYEGMVADFPEAFDAYFGFGDRTPSEAVDDFAEGSELSRVDAANA